MIRAFGTPCYKGVGLGLGDVGTAPNSRTEQSFWPTDLRVSSDLVTLRAMTAAPVRRRRAAETAAPVGGAVRPSARGLRALLHLLQISSGLAWVPTCLYEARATTPECLGGLPSIKQASATGQRAISMLWSYYPSDSAGLGRGISWAWDETLCQTLLPKFDEDLWFMDVVTCTSLRASMVRAFSSWSAHHPLIYFHDVSFQCSQFPLGHPRSLLVKTLDGVRCSLAEIWVTSNSLSSRQADLAASATTRLVSHGSRRPFRATNGALALNRVLEAESATIGFNHSMCWYLDSTFCSTLHDWKRAAGHGNALLLSRMLIFMIWAAVSLESLLAFVRFWRRHRRAAAFEAAATMRQARGNGGEGGEGGGVGMDEDAAGLYAYTMHRLSHASTCCLAVRSMLVVTPLMLYWKVLLPCWECFDFEVAAGMLTGGRSRCLGKAAPCANVLSSILVAAVHEIGHLLGLSHPDAAQPLGKNLRLRGQYNCSDSWASVEAMPTAAEQGGEAVAAAASVMFAFTQHPRHTCISQDDLDALNVLYPSSCGEAAFVTRTPQCHTMPQLIGLVRLAVYVLLPTLAVVLLSVIANGLLMAKRRRAEKQFAKAHAELSARAAAMRRDFTRRKHVDNRTRRQQTGRDLLRLAQGVTRRIVDRAARNLHPPTVAYCGDGEQNAGRVRPPRVAAKVRPSTGGAASLRPSHLKPAADREVHAAGTRDQHTVKEAPPRSLSTSPPTAPATTPAIPPPPLPQPQASPPKGRKPQPPVPRPAAQLPPVPTAAPIARPPAPPPPLPSCRAHSTSQPSRPPASSRTNEAEGASTGDTARARRLELLRQHNERMAAALVSNRSVSA